MPMPCNISDYFRLEATLRGKIKHMCEFPHLQKDGRYTAVISGRMVGSGGARGGVHGSGAHGGMEGLLELEVGEGVAERPERVR